MLAAGNLNTRVTIESRSTSTDLHGQPVETWAPFASAWAWIRVPTGVAASERIQADREIAPVAVSVRIRYRTDITPAMRVVYGVATWQISSVIEDVAGREYVDLVCVKER